MIICCIFMFIIYFIIISISISIILYLILEIHCWEDNERMEISKTCGS